MIVKMKLKDRAPSPHPLPDGERAFHRDLARATLLSGALASRMAERVRGNEVINEKDMTCH